MIYFLFLSIILVAEAVKAAEYHWPSPQYDALEEFFYEGIKADGIALGGTVFPCRMRTTESNHSAAAEWLRFAYHDVSTYNISDGTGGLDGSLAFEIDREENIGQGMGDTLNDFLAFPSKYVSRSDVIAVGVVFAVSACGGPIIPFRGGRVDANQAGIFGVPDVSQDLATHTAMFARQGFSQSEMIQLVACGHTLGTVAAIDFPAVVPTDTRMFDNTLEFDNTIVQEYLSGTTQDPLIIGANATLMSDARIFAADNNATMQAMADASAFASTCKDVLYKMINIVPNTVTLTDEITLLRARVSGVRLTVDHDELLFKVSFRYVNTPSNSNRVVTLLWCDRYGDAKDCAGNVARYTTPKTTRDNESPVLSAQSIKLRKYDFAVHLNASQSISKFWFTVDEKNGTQPTTYDNGGTGYVIDQDEVLFVPSLSYKIGFNATLNSRDASSLLIPRGGDAASAVFNTYTYGLTVGVRTANPTRVYLNAFDRATTNFIPFNQTVELTLNSSYPAAAGYTFYTGGLTSSGKQTSVDSFVVHGDGNTYTDDFKMLYDVSATEAASPPTKEQGTDVQTTQIAAPSGTDSNAGVGGGERIPRVVVYLAVMFGLMWIPGVVLWAS